MSCGKVVVACRNTALPELIDHGKTGILCATDDVDGMVDAIRQLAENFELRKSMGRNARLIAEERFNESRMVNEYVLLYKKLLCSLQ
jgi:glycosyltransferase involved in cell wall biosynthesis